MGAIMENYVQPARFSKGKICNVKRINKADVDMSYRSCHSVQAAAAAEIPPPPPEVPSELTAAELFDMIKKLKEWSKPNKETGIGKFLKRLDPEKIYTFDELLKYATDGGFWENPKTCIPQLTHFKVGGRGFGKIMKMSGNTYQMYPELVKHYNEFF